MPTAALVYDVARLDERLLLDRMREVFDRVELVHLPSTVLGFTGKTRADADIAVQRSMSFYRALTSTFALEAQGVRVVNTGDAILFSGDKTVSTSLLVRSHVPVPETLLAYSLESTVKAAETLGYPVVLKPIQGSWGRLLAMARDEEELRAIIEHREYMGALYRVQYVQEYVRKPGRDIRAMCIGDSVPAAIYRVSGSWITNTARGGRAMPARVTPEMEDLTLRACKALGVEVGGVDIVEHPEKGLLVLEVNAVPEYKNIMRVTGIDIARRIAEYLYGEAKR